VPAALEDMVMDATGSQATLASALAVITSFFAS
jgi:hypothetical protein